MMAHHHSLGDAAMKLYYAPGASSLAPHIALREAGLAFQLERVDLRTRKTEHDADYLRINPNGYVPALQFDDGTVLTEICAMVQWIADQVPDAGLAPPAGTLARYRLMQWLSFVSSELHKSFGPLFDPAAPEAVKTAARGRIERRLPHVGAQLAQQPYLLGDTFSVADMFLFPVLSWTRALQIDTSKWPGVAAFLERVGERPTVRAAMAAERAGQ
jgi:glutathione S-transferase